MSFNYHNTDIAACDNDYCQMKLECLRWWLGINKDPHQVYAQFSPTDDECDGFIYYEPYKQGRKEIEL